MAMSYHFVIACGAEKTAHAAPAADLYVGTAFRHFLNAATTEAAATTRDLGTDATVWILSAKHGLVALTDVLDPYNVKMGDDDSIDTATLATQAAAYFGDDEVFGMLPAKYLDALTAAGAYVQNTYEAAPGIGYQRGVASSMIRSA